MVPVRGETRGAGVEGAEAEGVQAHLLLTLQLMLSQQVGLASVLSVHLLQLCSALVL